jgi:preprotein translocase subunit YajC
MNLQYLLAMAPQGGEGGGGGFDFSFFIMMGAVIVIMYFLMIRPQQKRQKEHQKMLSEIKSGDNVITSTGIHGKVTEVDDKTMVLQIADGVKVRFEKSAVAQKK